METQNAEKDKATGFAKTIAVALLAITVVHFGAFLVWIGASNEKFSRIAESDKWQTEAIYKLQGVK